MNRFSKTLICACVAASMALTGCGGKGDIDLKENAKSVSELSIPEGVRIVGLGEASHGNKEFQELKLEVFKLLVENYGVRAFCLEGDDGNYKKVNAYIQGEDVTLDEAVEALTFTIYKTEDSKELIEWMKEYNDTHEV
ncbi:MAG: erythromycin esterase family protein, partial [Lachnospiraceae bacterium]|nr:erythromycin esterase family protein [Lachnospiraceae bacterium]